MENMNFSGIDFENRPKDEKFMQKFLGIIDANLADEHFSVRKLASGMAMSRIQLYRRLRKIAGKNISQFIREYRLEKAMDLLKKDVATVSEIAYQVGFGSPSYFNKCFHAYYGFPPGEVLKKQVEFFGEKPEIQNDFQVEKAEEGITIGKKNVFKNTNFWLILSVIIGISAIILVIWYMSAVNRLFNYFDEDFEILGTSPKTVAVLPFRNESPDLDNEYFCNGMQDEILNHLQKIADLSVRSRTSVEKYRDKTIDIPIIGEELNVAFILEGSILQSGENYRISAQLIETKSDNHLWGESYDLTYSDTILQVQTRIAKKIAASLQAVITPNEHKRMEIQYTTDINSYDYTIRGLQEMDNFFKYWDKKHLKEAFRNYQKAVKIDSENYKALVGIGNTHLYDTHIDSTIYYCNKAITLNPEFSEGYHVRAAYYDRKSNYDRAIEDYLKTIELSPNDAMAHNQLGEIYFMQKKDVIKGFMHLNKSLELNVTSQPYIFFWAGMCYLHVGDYEKAKKLALKMIDVEMNCDGIHLYSWCLMIQRKHKEAFAFLDTICNQSECNKLCMREKWFHSYCNGDLEQAGKYYQELVEKGYTLAVHWKIGVANMYMQLGRKDEAVILLDSCRTIYENSIEKWGETWYNTFNVSQVYILLGEKEKGLRYLSKATEIGMLGGWHDLMEVDPIYESLWSEPEFQDILRKTKEEKAALRAQIRDMEENNKR